MSSIRGDIKTLGADVMYLDRAENFKCEKRSYSNHMDTHSHGYNQLILPLDGQLNIRTKGHDLSLDSDHLFFLPPDCRHDFYADSTNQFLVVDIPQNIIGGYHDLETGQGMHRKLDEKWKAMRVLLHGEADSKTGSDSLVHLMNYALGFLKENPLPESIKYIHGNLEKQLTIEVLAGLEHFNPTYYSEWFKSQMGMTPNAYIQKMRMEKAKMYLKESNLSIMEISYLVGYENQSSLSRNFKRHYGISPAVYRKKCRG